MFWSGFVTSYVTHFLRVYKNAEVLQAKGFHIHQVSFFATVISSIVYLSYFVEYVLLHIYIKYLDNYEENKKIKEKNANITIKTLPSKSVKGNQKSYLG